MIGSHTNWSSGITGQKKSMLRYLKELKNLKGNLGMLKATLTKLSDNQNALRTNTMSGVAHLLPTPNACFVILGEAIDKSVGDARMIKTSLVQEVVSFDTHERRIVFKTLNSTYQLDITDERPLEDLIKTYADPLDNPYLSN